MKSIPLPPIDQQKMFIEVSQKLEAAQKEIERLQERVKAKTGPIHFESPKQRNKYVNAASALGFKMSEYALFLFEKDWQENDKLKKARKDWEMKDK